MKIACILNVLSSSDNLRLILICSYAVCFNGISLVSSNLCTLIFTLCTLIAQPSSPYSSPYSSPAMKVGRRNFNSSHQIYHRQRRWMIELITVVETKLNEYLSEASVIVSKYIKMTGLQDFY